MTQQVPSIDLASLIQQSAFDQFIRWLHRTRAIVAVSLALFLVPVLAAIAEGVLGELFSSGLWRLLFIQPTIVVYILTIAPFIQRAHARLLDSLQRIIETAPEEIISQVRLRARRLRRGDWIAALVGALIGLAITVDDPFFSDMPWLFVCYVGTVMAMYAGIAWVIYGSIGNARITSYLLRQPLRVDILDIRPFEPVGYASLLTSMAFIIGATLAIVISVIGEWTLSFFDLVAYAFFSVVAILVFILEMQDTHRILVDAKQREVDLARSRVAEAYQDVKCRAMRGESIQVAVAEMNAWIACRERLEQARTWPYNVDMIRKLLISSLLPIGVAAVRQWGTALLSMIKLPF